MQLCLTCHRFNYSWPEKTTTGQAYSLGQQCSFWGLLLMAAMNIVALVKSFVCLALVVNPLGKKLKGHWATKARPISFTSCALAPARLLECVYIMLCIDFCSCCMGRGKVKQLITAALIALTKPFPVNKKAFPFIVYLIVSKYSLELRL